MEHLGLTPNEGSLALEMQLVAVLHPLKPGSKVAALGLAERTLEDAAWILVAGEADDDGGGEGDLREGLRVAGEVPSQEGDEGDEGDDEDENGVHGFFLNEQPQNPQPRIGKVAPLVNA